MYGALFDSLLHVDNTHASLYFQFPSWSLIFWWQWGSHCLSGRRLAYGSTVWGLITKISSKIASIDGEEGELVSTLGTSLEPWFWACIQHLCPEILDKCGYEVSCEIEALSG